MKKRISLKLFDFFSFGLALFVLLFSIIINFSGSGSDLTLLVKTREADYVYDLKENRELVFEGPLGDTVIEIKDKMLRVLRSPCPEQICVNSGWISHQGQWLGCLPNQVFLSLEGKVENEVDAYSY
ncbi:MAG: NusG domain II-containing protein [Spirochaetales bacterium]|nr:NusG domain II-containing protein [Spirochaetales bacterium]